MSKFRGTSSEKLNKNLHKSLRAPNPAPRKDSIKSKIAKFESRLKTLQMIRDLKSQSSTEASQIIKIPKNEPKKGFLCSSFQTDFTNIDLSSIEPTEILKSDSQRKLLSQNLDSSLLFPQSPLRKIKEIDQDLEKTPGFKKKFLKKNSSVKKPKKKNKENQKSVNFKRTEPAARSQVNQEKIYKEKLSELNREHERRMKVLEDRIYCLIKDNENLISIIERKKELNCRGRFFNEHDDYESLLSRLEEMKEKNQLLERNLKNVLCNKCKAFVSTSNEIMSKVGRIKEYINND